MKWNAALSGRDRAESSFGLCLSLAVLYLVFPQTGDTQHPPPQVIIPPVTTYAPAWELYGALHLRPFYIAAYPVQNAVRPSVLFWDADDWTTLYRLDDTPVGVRLVPNGTTGGWQMTYFETRPQIAERGLVWVMALNRTSALDIRPPVYDYAFLAFDAATLKVIRTLRQPVFKPTLVNGHRYETSFFCTDSAGVIFLSKAEAIYSINPVTGLQTGHFNLTVMDLTPATHSHYGYYIGFTSDDVLWAIDKMWVDQTLGMMRSRKNGTIMSQAYVELPYTAQNRMDGFSVDSAGNAYLTLYGDDALQSRAYVISPSFAVTFLAAPFLGSIYSRVDLQVSIAWGKTPADDLIIQYEWFSEQMSIQHSNGAVVTSINPRGSSRLDWGYDMAYDTFQDSLVVAWEGGAARLSMSDDLLALYPVPSSYPSGGVTSGAVDGLGRVLVAVTWDWTSNVGPFDLHLFAADSSLTWRLVNASNTLCIAMDGAHSLIWIAHGTDLTTEKDYSFSLASLSYATGQRTAQLPSIYGSPRKIAPYDATRLAVLVYDGRAGVYNTVYLVSTITGATTTLFSVDPGAYYLDSYAFSISKDHTLAYIYGYSADYRVDLGYIVSLPSGERFAAVEPAYPCTVFNAQNLLCAYGGPLLIWDPFALPQPEAGGSRGGSGLSGGAVAGIVIGAVGVVLLVLLVLLVLVCRRAAGNGQGRGSGRFGSMKDEETEVEMK